MKREIQNSFFFEIQVFILCIGVGGILLQCHRKPVIVLAHDSVKDVFDDQTLYLDLFYYRGGS